jgi:hypothetical protein
MKISQIRSFHKVASTCSFTRAIRELFVTQPAVSKEMEALQASLGMVNLRSSPRPCSPGLIARPVATSLLICYFSLAPNDNTGLSFLLSALIMKK